MKATSGVGLLALLLVGMAPQEDKKASCANHLQTLWKFQNVYMSQFGGRMKKMPDDIGPDFWLALEKTKPPILDAASAEFLVCPLSKDKPKAGFTNYRGPAKKISELKASDAVGCCEPGSHPDGTITVLYKDGDVKVLKPSDDLYKKALETTAGRPEKK